MGPGTKNERAGHRKIMVAPDAAARLHITTRALEHVMSMDRATALLYDIARRRLCARGVDAAGAVRPCDFEHAQSAMEMYARAGTSQGPCIRPSALPTQCLQTVRIGV